MPRVRMKTRRFHEHRSTAKDVRVCRCGALLCTCCMGDSAGRSVMKVFCTLCHGEPWFEMGEYSDATGPEDSLVIRIKPNEAP